jgi:hypothetical protein
MKTTKEYGKSEESGKVIKIIKDKRYERNNSLFNIDWPFALLSSVPKQKECSGFGIAPVCVNLKIRWLFAPYICDDRHAVLSACVSNVKILSLLKLKPVFRPVIIH